MRCTLARSLCVSLSVMIGFLCRNARSHPTLPLPGTASIWNRYLWPISVIGNDVQSAADRHLWKMTVRLYRTNDHPIAFSTLPSTDKINHLVHNRRHQCYLWRLLSTPKALMRSRTDHFSNAVLLWIWTLTYDLHRRIWPRQCKVELADISFKTYGSDIQAHKHWHIQGEPKSRATDSWPYFCQILTDLKKIHWKIPR